MSRKRKLQAPDTDTTTASHHGLRCFSTIEGGPRRGKGEFFLNGFLVENFTALGRAAANHGAASQIIPRVGVLNNRRVLKKKK